MFGRSLRSLVGAAVLATVVMAMSANRADAGWHHWRWGGYYSPYVTSWYPAGYYGYSWSRPWYGVSSCCYPSYSVGYCSSCYCSPCSCYSSCYSPCYSSCCSPVYSTVVGCCGGGVITGGTVIQGESYQKGTEAGKPMLAPPREPEGAEPNLDSIPPGAGGADPAFPAADRSGGSTILTVDVPADARVLVNGMLTKTPGTHRRYISRGLTPGFRYTYEIRAELTRDGKTQSDTKVVHVRAGETNDLAFTFDGSESLLAAAPAVTTLTLHVPADARVSLGGNETASSGEIRQFTTSELTRGEKWDDYKIVVTIEREGELVTREKSLAIAGGDAAELTFDFTEESLALR